MAFLGSASQSMSQIAQQICRAVAIEYPTTVDPEAAAPSTDPIMYRVAQAIADASTKLSTMRRWQDLTVQASMVIQATAPGESEVQMDLPDDFLVFVDQTQNDATARWPGLGPISNRQWQGIKNLSPSITINAMWRMNGNKVCFLFPFASAHTFTYEYISKGLWTDGTNTFDTPQKNSHLSVLDPTLVMLLGKAKWLEYSGFDASAAMRDFSEAFDTRFKDGAPLLNMAGNGMVVPLLSTLNLPQTGYGV
jgi:hypothetical protein